MPLRVTQFEEWFNYNIVKNSDSLNNVKELNPK